ncbi:MAG: hypothetical protein V4547_18225 [Bacteroidota bacterium]
MQTLQEQLKEAENKVFELQQKLKESSTPANGADSRPIYEKITTLPQVYDYLKIDVSTDKVKLAGFTEAEYNVLNGLIARMRIAKCYNELITPKLSDYRHYPFHRVSGGSGLVFHHSDYDDDCAHTGSAARLAFLSEEGSDAYDRNFHHIEEQIIKP